LAKNKLQKQKAWPSAMPFVNFLFFPDLYFVFSSVFRVQPSIDPDLISLQSVFDRWGPDYETPDMHQQDSS